MIAFGFALGSHNEFLGYHGDFDAASASCFKTAIVFGGISAVSLLTFVIGAVRMKLGGPPKPAAHSGDYQAV